MGGLLIMGYRGEGIRGGLMGIKNRLIWSLRKLYVNLCYEKLFEV